MMILHTKSSNKPCSRAVRLVKLQLGVVVLTAIKGTGDILKVVSTIVRITSTRLTYGQVLGATWSYLLCI